jgi:hypothetical protein
MGQMKNLKSWKWKNGVVVESTVSEPGLPDDFFFTPKNINLGKFGGPGNGKCYYLYILVILFEFWPTIWVYF